MRYQGCGERNPQTREQLLSELVSVEPGHDAGTRQSKHAKRQARLGCHANRDREVLVSLAHLLVSVRMIFSNAVRGEMAGHFDMLIVDSSIPFAPTKI